MINQDYPQIAKDEQWEYAMFTMASEAGGVFGIGKQTLVSWVSTLADENGAEFTGSLITLFERAGSAGWEMVTSPVATDQRTAIWAFTFKQRPATNEDSAIAQLIDPTALLRRATKYLAGGNTSMALKAINRAFAMRPEKQIEVYHLARGRILMALNELQDAEQEFVATTKANSQSGEAHCELGNISFQSQNFEMITETRYRRGIAFSHVGKPKDAVKDLKEYLNRSHPNADKRSEIESLIRKIEGK